MTKHEWECTEIKLPDWSGLPHLHRAIWRCKRCGIRCYRELRRPNVPEAKCPPGWRETSKQKIWSNCDRQLAEMIHRE